MNERIQAILTDIRELEDQLAEEMESQRAELIYWFEGRRVRFETSIRDAQRRVRVNVLRWLSASSARNLLSAPFIYAMILPFALLDATVSVYQAICFRLYRIPRVRREVYIVIDRHQLSYLNLIERLNCTYCGYANGVIAYTREIAARTEQYWCPIKHARRVLDPHRRYAHFADFGEYEAYHGHLLRMRAAVRDDAHEPAEEDRGDEEKV